MLFLTGLRDCTDCKGIAVNCCLAEKCADKLEIYHLFPYQRTKFEIKYKSLYKFN